MKQVEPELKITFRAKHKFIFRFFMFILIIGLIVAGVKIFNYSKFVLGYDLTFRLSVDKHELALANGEEAQVEFTIEKISNVLCKTFCHYQFRDLSKGLIMDEDSFMPVQSINKNIIQTIRAPLEGEGQVIYSFDLTCQNQITQLCNTEGLNLTRRTIISLDHNLNNEQLNLKKEVATRLYLAQTLLIQSDNLLKEVSPSVISLNPALISSQDYDSLKRAYRDISLILEENLPFWIKQDYSSINLKNIDNKLSILKDAPADFNKNINSNIISYNFMINKFATLSKKLETIKNLNLNQTQAERLEALILEFNQKILLFSQKDNLADKNEIFNAINSLSYSEFVDQSINYPFNFSKTNLFNLVEINYILPSINNSLSITLPQTKKTCCLDNICQSCEIQKKYPVLLLHGHNFNKDISADNIINDFEEIQNKLNSAGYLNIGELYLYESIRAKPGILGFIPKPIAVRPSYYFDFLKKPEGYKSVQIKSENIDTYAIRLREIIENVKYETSSPKVIIIAHSMGGLVVRRYIQIFGKESLDRLIFIDTPNLGIIGSIANSCPIFGALSECEDMKAESLLLNKLNREDLAMPKTYNLIGIGCKMNEGDGDGIVLAKNGLLPESETVKNFYINGTCSGVSFFHNNILDVNQYPEVFDLIEKALKE